MSEACNRWVFCFDAAGSDGDPERRDLLGGKGASLAAMTRAGLPVPPGFTISTQCCRLFHEAGRRWPEGVQSQIREAMGRLEAATGRHFGDAERPLLVSVRSGAAVSMPGMMDTMLNCGLSPQMADAFTDPAAFWRVYCQFARALTKTSTGAGDIAEASGPAAFRQLADEYAVRTGELFPVDPWRALVACIERVFDSWHNERAVAYRREHHVTGLPGTAVTVQAMFPSGVSGVAFTRDPNRLAGDEMVVESSFGLGESVVSGDVHPDHFVLDRDTGRVKRRAIGHKSHVVSALGDAVSHDADAASLTDAQLTELWRLAMRVEGHFGHPVDIEWGLADGRFALLQSRPIRALEQTHLAAELIRAQREELRKQQAAGRGPWVLHNLAETLPLPTPLTWSVIGKFMRGSGGFGAMYRLAGFRPGPVACREGFVQRIAGRIYMDAARAGEMFFADYPYAYDVELLRSNPDAAENPPGVPARWLGARLVANRRARCVDRRLRRMARSLDRRLIDVEFPRFQAYCRDEKRRDLAAMSAEELAASWRSRRRAVLDEFAPLSLLPSLVSGAAVAHLREFLAEHFWNDDTDELAAMLSAPPLPDRTIQASADLFAVAQGRLSVDTWLGTNGHRGPEEFDLAAPRWREQPASLLAMARGLRDGADPMQLHRARRDRTERQLLRLASRLAGRDARRLRERVEVARRYVVFREDGKHFLMMGYDLLRDVALQVAHRLDLGGDVFLLTADEMLGALGAGRVDRELVGRRKAERQAQTRFTLPRVIDAGAMATLGESGPGEGGGGDGMGLSAGVARGPAWIAAGPHEPAPPRGYVLVCRSTDPAWTPLFVNAAGLVLESGGTLSHGAVIAREMGIPAIVLPGATGRFEQGERIVVDGTNGVATRESDYHRAQPAIRREHRLSRRAVPPPAGLAERRAGRLRNVCLLAWGAMLVAMWLLPGRVLYEPAMRVLDAVLWPIVRLTGRVGAVAIIAAGLALLTMLGQRVLTDNRRLLEARRRREWLSRKASALPPDSPRRAPMLALAGPVQVRLLLAAFVPLAALLGPMVLTFLWIPARLAPDVRVPPAGSRFSIIADVERDVPGGLELSADPRLTLESWCAPHQVIPPVDAEQVAVRQRLADWAGRLDAGQAVPELASVVAGGERSAAAEIRALLAAPPVRSVSWALTPPSDSQERFDVTIAAGQWRQAVPVAVGPRFAPSPTVIVPADGSPVKAIRVQFDMPPNREPFWSPLARLHPRAGVDFGWLGVYLLAYLPAMFVSRRLLRVA